MTWTQTQLERVREVPLSSNGYAGVATPALRIPAREVKAGDILLLEDCVSLVHTVDAIDIQPPYQSMAVWLRGDLNIIRFPHEMVSVLRRPTLSP